MIGSPLLGRLTGPAEIVGRNEKKGCAAGEAVHSNEWKYMVVMCCNEWCSFQGPGPPPGGATTSLLFQLVPSELYLPFFTHDGLSDGG